MSNYREIWDGLTPVDKDAVKVWCQKYTNIEQVVSDLCEVSVDDDPRYDIPRFYPGDVVNADIVDISGIFCEVCGSFFDKEEFTAGKYELVLEHAIMTHLPRILAKRQAVSRDIRNWFSECDCEAPDIKEVEDLGRICLNCGGSARHEFDLDDLKPYSGGTIEIAGQTFELYIEHDCAGDWACWSSDSYLCYATPGYEQEHGVPVDIRPMNDPCVILDTRIHDKPIYSFEEYLAATKELIEELIFATQKVEQEATL